MQSFSKPIAADIHLPAGWEDRWDIFVHCLHSSFLGSNSDADEIEICRSIFMLEATLGGRPKREQTFWVYFANRDDFFAGLRYCWRRPLFYIGKMECLPDSRYRFEFQDVSGRTESLPWSERPFWVIPTAERIESIGLVLRFVSLFRIRQDLFHALEKGLLCCSSRRYSAEFLADAAKTAVRCDLLTESFAKVARLMELSKRGIEKCQKIRTKCGKI